MPATLSYPGVYIEEIPSGVHTITGVSTSVTAFVGSAKRGSINNPIHILSFSDYERRFGGLQIDSEMSYAVRQFFLNGGSDAWVVRLAKGVLAASQTLQNSTLVNALRITALEEGNTGNDIEVRVSYDTGNPTSTFNLTFNFVSTENPSDSATERFTNLSMNSQDSRYAVDIVNAGSQLVRLERVVPLATLAGLGTGTSTSALLTGDVQGLLDSTHNQIRISVNGLPPVAITFNLPSDVSGANANAHLASLCAAIQNAVRAAGNQPPLTGFTCAANATNDRIVMTSGAPGETSSVRVLPGDRNDAASRLKLGTLNGGAESDATAPIRPAEAPNHGTLTSGVFGLPDLDGLPAAAQHKLQISLDGYGPDEVDIGITPASGGNNTSIAKLPEVAGRIQTAVRGLKPSNPAYRDFICTADMAAKIITLASGTRGLGSSVLVSAAASNDIAGTLRLLSGTTSTQPTNLMLQNGSETPYTAADQYNLFIADRSQRQGIYALESVDLFNLLCLPGVTDSGVLMDAASYCQERRAFLIADAPPTSGKPDEMVQTISGTALPKTDYGAVYYPWFKIADPLRGGQLRTTAPSGTIAGLYARTDSTRGVWKAPAGTEATLVGVQEMQYKLTDLENGTLNPLGVNCLRVFPVFGAIAWGARTLRGADQMTSEYKYIPVRRLALFLEESLYRATKWVVFEPNDEPLWAQIRLNAGAFMHNLFRQGAFQGATPKDAYFVKCDKETTTQADVNLGIVNIVVGFAPLKPAEFVVIQLQQMAGQIET